MIDISVKYVKAVILAGGLGTRISEETHLRPKPMVEIGGKPILWHIMKLYSFYGITDFIICCGYKGYVIKEYFANYMLHTSDVTIDMKAHGSVTVKKSSREPWNISLIDTGEFSMTAGRLRYISDYIDDEPFCFTYGDGLSDVNIGDLIDFHMSHKSLVTLTAVQPPGRYGALKFDGTMVEQFQEKPEGDNAWINGGFFVVHPAVLSLITDDALTWESHILPELALKSQLNAFKHSGFWQPMDTLRDKKQLEDLWNSKTAPWKVW